MGNVVTITVVVASDDSRRPRSAEYPDELPVQAIEPTSLDGPMLNDPPIATEHLMG
jgi:hypothetical protein